MNKPQKITLNILLGVLFSLCLYCMKNTVVFMFGELETYTQRCGKVINKIQPESLQTHKHSANLTVEEYLYIDYNGYIKKELVSADTWYKYNVGDSICITKMDNGFWPSVKKMTVFLGFIFWAILLFIVLYYAWHLMGGRTLKSIWDDEDAD